MDALVLLAIEADKPKKKEPVMKCGADMAKSDIIQAIGELAYCVDKVERQVSKVKQSIQKPTDYRMDVIRDEEGTIYQIDVKRVKT